MGGVGLTGRTRATTLTVPGLGQLPACELPKILFRVFCFEYFEASERFAYET